MTMTDGTLDEAYDRLHATGPELVGGLTNHAPMVVECLTHLGHGHQVHRWLDGYQGELDDRPRGRGIDDWQAALGDSRRIGDWLEQFARDDRPWQDLLALWWPRLMPGMAAAATHGVIRTGHAVRALQHGETPPRRAELGQALAYWAALWRPVPAIPPRGLRPARDALPSVPLLEVQQGRAGERLDRLAATPGWADAVAALQPPNPPVAALREVVDAALSVYATRAHGEPVMLVHAVTAPAAVLLALPALPPELHLRSVETAWATSAAVVAAYAGRRARPATRTPAAHAADAVERAVAHGDPHVVKLTEAAVRAEDQSIGLQAAAAALDLVER